MENINSTCNKYEKEVDKLAKKIYKFCLKYPGRIVQCDNCMQYIHESAASTKTKMERVFDEDLGMELELCEKCRFFCKECHYWIGNDKYDEHEMCRRGIRCSCNRWFLPEDYNTHFHHIICRQCGDKYFFYPSQGDNHKCNNQEEDDESPTPKEDDEPPTPKEYDQKCKKQK